MLNFKKLFNAKTTTNQNMKQNKIKNKLSTWNNFYPKSYTKYVFLNTSLLNI